MPFVPIPELVTNLLSALSFQLSAFGFQLSAFGFRLSAFGFRLSGLRFGAWGFGFRVWGFGFVVPVPLDSPLSYWSHFYVVTGVGYRVYGVWCRV